MSIDEDYGYRQQNISATYYGLEEADGRVFAVVGGSVGGKELIARNDLAATIGMILFEFESSEQPSLNPQTEIRPLIGLVFANLERMSKVSGSELSEDFRLALFEKQFDKLPQIVALSDENKECIGTLIREHRSLWPQGVLQIHTEPEAARNTACPPPPNTPAPR